MKKSNALKIIVSLTILFLLIFKVGYEEIFKTLLRSNIWLILLIYALTITAFFLFALNYMVFFWPNKVRLGIGKIMKATILSWSLGTVSPGRIGELGFIYYLKKEIPDTGLTVAVFLLNKVTTFIVYSIFCFIGIIYFFSLKMALIFIALSISCLIIFGIFFVSGTGRRLIKKFLIGKYHVHFKKFGQTMKILFSHPAHIILNILITTLSLFIIVLNIWLAMKSVDPGVKIALIFLVFITVITQMSSLVPFTLSGIGIKESLAVFLFSEKGISSVTVLSAFIILNLVKYTLAFVSIILLDKKKD